jgi:outer membrane protein OmpA-like peptidoglycan-associated protein
MKLIFLLSFTFLFNFYTLSQDEILTNQGYLKSYQNYDFIPGDKIIFEDDFTSSRDGEFPPMWKLIAGQGVINKIDGELVFVVTEGSYGKVAPRIKTKKYLDKTFTVECDYISQKDEYGLSIFFVDQEGDNSKAIIFSPFGDVQTEYFFPEGSELQGKHPDTKDEKYVAGVWRHAAIVYKDGQMKCYVDQYRILVIPNCEFTPTEVLFGGNAPNLFKNVKIANGGGMNMLDQIYKDGKLITHGILFDINKATIKASSMGLINEIVKLMKEHQELKFSIEGHTDSDGDDKSNLKLSEQRADAVKKALIDLGIDSTRLQTKGWGESKPISKNDTPEGKANNRRVEFVKI